MLGGGCIQWQPCLRQQWELRADPHSVWHRPGEWQAHSCPAERTQLHLQADAEAALQMALSRSHRRRRGRAQDTTIPKTVTLETRLPQTPSPRLPAVPLTGAASTASPA